MYRVCTGCIPGSVHREAYLPGYTRRGTYREVYHPIYTREAYREVYASSHLQRETREASQDLRIRHRKAERPLRTLRLDPEGQRGLSGP